MAWLSAQQIVQRVLESERSAVAKYFTLIIDDHSRVYVSGYVGMGESEAHEVPPDGAATVRHLIDVGSLIVDRTERVSVPLIEFREEGSARVGYCTRYVEGFRCRPTRTPFTEERSEQYDRSQLPMRTGDRTSHE